MQNSGIILYQYIGISYIDFNASKIKSVGLKFHVNIVTKEVPQVTPYKFQTLPRVSSPPYGRADT